MENNSSMQSVEVSFDIIIPLKMEIQGRQESNE